MLQLPFYRFLILSFLFLSGIHISTHAQDKWVLSTDHNGIKVYTRHVPDSKIKAVKVVAAMQASSSQLVAAILDIQTCTDWVYHSKKNVMVKQISPLELIYYSEVEVPWPVENRDFVVHIKAEQDPQTKVITINSPCVPGYVPVKEDLVRISQSVGKWVIMPAGKDQVNAEYTLEVDPGGNIPAWLINLFATKGPMETFKKLKVHVQQDVYKKANFKQITD